MRALAILVLLPAVASASPEQTLADLQTSYAQVKHLQGEFDQTTIYATFGSEEKSRGNLYLARPDKMRWDYKDAKGKLKRSMIFDGKHCGASSGRTSGSTSTPPRTRRCPRRSRFSTAASSPTGSR